MKSLEILTHKCVAIFTKLRTTVESLLFLSTSVSVFYLFAFWASITTILVFYPGLFPNDSVFQLKQAESGVYQSWHPAIMAILMHYLLFLGKGGIFVVHQLLYWFGLAFFFDKVLQYRNPLFLLFIGFFPSLFLVTLCVWKDAGFLVCSIWSIALLHCFYTYRKKYI